MENMSGVELGRYKIKNQIGKGGIAVVYKAYDAHLETDVAVKFLRLDLLSKRTSEVIRKRFQIEAQKMAQLTHANIVRVTDFGEHEKTPYLVMPYMAGGSLDERMGKRMAWQDALRLLLPIAKALDYTHQKGLIHRDIKPSNILVTDAGQPMLSDFGITKILESEETLDLTGTSLGMGTPEYMAPEQANNTEVDARVDIYALGVVLYEMITGRKPFTADTPMAIIIKHARDPLPSPKEMVPSLPDNVEKLVFCALAKNPSDRYENMAKLIAAIESCLKGQTQSAGAVMVVPQPVNNATKKSRQWAQGLLTRWKGIPRMGRYGVGAGGVLVVLLLLGIPMLNAAAKNEIQIPEVMTSTPTEDTLPVAAVVEPTATITPEPIPQCEAPDSQFVSQDWTQVYCETFDVDFPVEDWKVENFEDRPVDVVIEPYRQRLGVRALVEQNAKMYILSPAGEFRDFLVSVEGRMSGYSGAPYHDWGLTLKINENNFYYYKIDSDGRFSFSMMRDGKVSNLIATKNNNVTKPISEMNRLTVVVDGYEYKLYINGQLVGEIKDNRIMKGGVGLYLQMGGNATLDWEFDNFVVYAMQ